MNAIKNHADTYITNYLILNDEKIVRLRKKYQIPVEGFDWDDFLKTISYPPNWYYTGKDKEIKKIQNVVKREFKDYLFIESIEYDIFLYLIFNNIKGILEFNEITLIKIIDTVEQNKGLIDFSSKYKSITKEILLADEMYTAKKYPISILLTPEITKTTLKRFIDKNWKNIEELRQKYRNPLKERLLKINTKSKSFQSNLRRMFIFQNRNENSAFLQKHLREDFNHRISEEQIRSEKTEILKLLKKK